MRFPKGGSLTGKTIMWDDGTYNDVKKQLIKQGEEEYADVKFLPQKLRVKQPDTIELLNDLLVAKRLEREQDVRTALELYGLSGNEIEDALSKQRVEKALESIGKPSAIRREDALRTAMLDAFGEMAEPTVEPAVEPVRESRRAEEEPVREPIREPEVEMEETEPAMPVRRLEKRGRKQADFPSAKTLQNNPARVFELAREYGISLTKRGGQNKNISELAGEIVSKYPAGTQRTR